MWGTRELSALTTQAIAYVAASYTVGLTFVAAGFSSDLAHTLGMMIMLTSIIALPFAFVSVFLTAVPVLLVITLETALRHELNLYGWCLSGALWAIIVSLPIFSAGNPRIGALFCLFAGISGGGFFYTIRSKLRAAFKL